MKFILFWEGGGVIVSSTKYYIKLGKVSTTCIIRNNKLPRTKIRLKSIFETCGKCLAVYTYEEI